MSRNLAFVLLLGALGLGACAYPTRNAPIQTLSTDYGYRWNRLPADDLPGTLVIVTASGGGTRAAALELGVLRGMQQVELPSGKRLVDEVDVISSVSGGSVTAAYFALKGSKGFDDLENNFIRKNGIDALLKAILNPVQVARLSTPSRERIDLLIDYFDSTLFHKEKMGALQEPLDGSRRPFLVLNAADMVEGTPFPLTQSTFDLLCSDVSKLKLSTAVAASAAFPVAFSPVTLKNYSRCPAQAGRAWPPAWVADAAEDPTEGTAWYDNPDAVNRARVAKAYAEGTAAPHPKAYIHLLDGGIADNLGVTEPLRMLATTELDPSFINAIGSGKITRIVFVTINARSAVSSKLDAKPDTPGIFDMLMGSVGASVDRAALGAGQRLRALLESEFALFAREQEGVNPDMARRFAYIIQNTSLISIDFDAIPKADCRLAYHSIGTSWTNSKAEIDALLKVGPALLAGDPEFPHLLALTGGRLAEPLPTLHDACAIVPAP